MAYDVAQHRRFHILTRIVNYPAIRRACGPSIAAGLAVQIVSRVRNDLSFAETAAVSRDLVEVTFVGVAQFMIDNTLAGLRQAAADITAALKLSPGIELTFGVESQAADIDDPVDLIERAERALATSDDRYADDNREITSPEREAARLASELRLAIVRDELVLHYQPKVHVRRQEIGSAEALIRWQHPERGLIPPGEFIGIAEQSGLIGPLTLWTIERAMRDQVTLRDAGHDLRIFINISGQLLADDIFVEKVCQMVADSDAKLGFEVTETSVIRDPQCAIANLQQFADIGIVVAIDDYGAGLSSLAYLKQLPARELKIDKLFVTQLTSSNRDPLIVRSTIDLAHALEMEVVAEGVESPAALALLTVMGCDMIQGYLISRPIELDALVTFLHDEKHSHTPQQTCDSFMRLATVWKRA